MSQRRNRYFVQSRSKVLLHCRQDGCPQPKLRAVSKELEQRVVDRELSLEALAFYAFILAHATNHTVRDSVCREKLALSRHQSLRLRGELREHSLSLVAQPWKCTNTCILKTPVPRSMHAALEEEYAALQRAWLKAIPSNRADPLSNYISRRIGEPGMMKLSYFQVTMYGGCALALPELRGMERLKAMGLWLLLANADIRHNWKSPCNVARELGCVSRRKAGVLLSHLQLLGLAYYHPEQSLIGVSQILSKQAGYGHMHPLEIDAEHAPWCTFANHR